MFQDDQVNPFPRTALFRALLARVAIDEAARADAGEDEDA